MFRHVNILCFVSIPETILVHVEFHGFIICVSPHFTHDIVPVAEERGGAFPFPHNPALSFDPQETEKKGLASFMQVYLLNIFPKHPKPLFLI